MLCNSEINERDLLGAGKYGRSKCVLSGSKCVLSVENKLLYSPAAGPNEAWKTFSQLASAVASLPIERQTGVCHLSIVEIFCFDYYYTSPHCDHELQGCRHFICLHMTPQLMVMHHYTVVYKTFSGSEDIFLDKSLHLFEPPPPFPQTIWSRAKKSNRKQKE